MTTLSLVTVLRAAGCVFAEDEARLLVSAASSADELDTMVRRRVAGLPLEHVLGWVEFCGLRIVVEEGVFVPRRRTEVLVEHAVELALQRGGGAAGGCVVVDLCCGCGAVGVAVTTMLRERLKPVRLYAVDVEPAAVRCARRNVESLGGSVLEGDLYAPLPAALRRRVDVVVANAPYVPTDSISLMPPEARLFEPKRALDGGADGLDVQRRIVAEAAHWLAPGGHLLVETSAAQASSTVAAFEEVGLPARVVRDSDRGATVVIASMAG